MKRRKLMLMLLLTGVGVAVSKAKALQLISALNHRQREVISQQSNHLECLQAKVYNNFPSKIYLFFSADITNQPNFKLSNGTIDCIEFIGSTIVLGINRFYQSTDQITISSNTIQSGSQDLTLVNELVINGVA